MESLISIENVTKSYKSNTAIFNALEGINLTINKGDNIAIVGKSGSGKTTLLNMIAGLDRPSEGCIKFKKTNISELSEKRLSSWRGANIGIVFQSFQLLPTLNILDNLLLPMDFLALIPSKNRKKRAMDLLDKAGVNRHATKYPGELSGGEQQRVAISRALVNNPMVILADEPTGNLDSVNSMLVKDIFKELHRNGKTIITITHEQVSTNVYDRVITLSDGKIQTTLAL